MTGGARSWPAAVAVLVVLVLALLLLPDAFAPAPSGPAGSTYATAPQGVAAWAELLARAGHPVAPLRVTLDRARLPAAATLVVLAAPAPNGAEVRALRRFVAAGGTLVLGGDGLPGAPLLPHPPRLGSAGSTVAVPVAGAPEVAGLRRVQTAGDQAWTGGGQPLLVRRGGGALLVLRRVGTGRIALLADPSALENQLLASADNAQLGLNLAGPAHRPVLFAEAVHGFGTATGVAAIPTRWWITFAGLLAAAALWAVARGRRLGAPERPAPAPPPPRSAYVQALASALVRARDRESLAELARAAGIEGPALGTATAKGDGITMPDAVESLP